MLSWPENPKSVTKIHRTQKTNQIFGADKDITAEGRDHADAEMRDEEIGVSLLQKPNNPPKDGVVDISVRGRSLSRARQPFQDVNPNKTGFCTLNKIDSHPTLRVIPSMSNDINHT